MGAANQFVTLELTLTSFFKVSHVKYKKITIKCADSILLSCSYNLYVLKIDLVQNSLMCDMPLYGNMPYISVNMLDRGILAIGYLHESG